MSDSTKVLADKAFQSFMDNMLVRMTIAQVKAEPDVLQALLRSAFDAGLQTGGIVVVTDLVTMMDRKKNG